MSELTERLRRGVQEYGKDYTRNWNISAADDLMDVAADRIEALEKQLELHEEPIGWEWSNRLHPEVTYVDKHRGRDPRCEYLDARPLYAISKPNQMEEK